MNYEKGNEILCIDDKNWKVPCFNYPKCGDVYTIRDILEYTDGTLGFLLNEITNPIIYPRKYETSFLAHRFIKLTLDEQEEEELTEEILVRQVEKMLNNGGY